MYYFGYCTWLKELEMKRFMPKGKFVAKGYYENSIIGFQAVGDRTDRGWCHLDITPSAWGQRTYGAVVEHDEEYFVDYPDFMRIAITVYGDDGKMYDCWTYVLENPGKAMKPPEAYWKNVRDGLVELEFSKDYRKIVADIYNNASDCSM